MNILEEKYVHDLLFRCHLRGNDKACILFDIYVALARIHARLETELKESGFNPPIGPDPSPELHWLLAGDSEGVPARIFPTAGFTSDRDRLRLGHESAVHLRATIMKVVSDLDRDIEELERGLEK